MWEGVRSNVKKSKLTNSKVIIYTGISLWGNEKWSMGDAKNLSSALKSYYSDHYFQEFIFSNDEIDNLPVLYPSAMFDLIHRHFNRIKNLTSIDDLVVIGFFSHGQEGALPLRLGENIGNKGQPNGVMFSNNIKEFLYPLKDTNVLLIISACYSGSFIQPLKSSNIVIATASSSDKTSKGCRPLSTGTFFVNNLLATIKKEKINSQHSIISVLHENRKVINIKEKWKEKSLPQVFVGNEFMNY